MIRRFLTTLVAAALAFAPLAASAQTISSAPGVPVSGGTYNGTILFSPDNTYDIGASGATRPKNGYFAGLIIAAGGFFSGGGAQVAATSDFEWNGRTKIFSTADGNINLTNNAGTNSATITVGASNALTFQAGITATGISSTSWVKTAPTTVVSLATCNAGNEGLRWAVTDATVAASGNFAAVVAGGGANHVPVYCDGTSWKIG